MSDDFGGFGVEDAEPDRVLVPAGEQTLAVRKAEWAVSPKRGQHLSLQLSGGNEYGLVFESVPGGEKMAWLRTAVGRAFSLVTPEGKIAWPSDISSLVGREVRVVITHRDTDVGTRANITRWIGPALGDAAEPDEPAVDSDESKGGDIPF